MESQLDPLKKDLTVVELTERYIFTKTGTKPSTVANYNFVMNILKKKDFDAKEISHIKTSDAKLFLIKLQSDGRGYSTVKTVRGIFRPAFQMAVDDDILTLSNFSLQA
jgi:hypothetical protein